MTNTYEQRIQEITAEEKAKYAVLKKIAAGFDNNTKIAATTMLSQEYICHIANKLVDDGLVEIIPEPRGGHTYVIKTETFEDVKMAEQSAE